MAVIHIDIDEGVLGHAPSRLRKMVPNLSQDVWEQYRHRMYRAIRPVLWYKQMILITLLGCLAVPLLAFVVLLGLVETGYLNLQDKDDDYDNDDQDNDYLQDATTTTEEDAIQLLLVVATCGCLALGALVLLLGSAIRVTTVQTNVETQLAPIVNDWTKLLEKNASQDDGTFVQVRILEAHPNTSVFRRAFLAWCDVDYVVVISDHDDSSICSSYSQETPLQQDVYERL